MRALVNVPHPEAVHSIRIMLESVGFEVLREKDNDAEYIQQSLVYNSYEMPPVATADCDLYVHVKPEKLKGRGLLFFINGGDHGANDFGVPTVTSNFYFERAFRVYVPYFNRLGITPREERSTFKKPMGLLHGANGWGFKRYFNEIKNDVDIWGVNSPKGILPQFAVKTMLSETQCFVHLKSNDAPGYALYEAFASAVPIVVSQFFVNKTMFHDLFVDGETCLVFGKGYEKWHHGGAQDEPREVYDSVVADIRNCIERLKDPLENRRIGVNGLFKWRELTRWTSGKRDKFAEYLAQNDLL